jgi:predicted permease
MRWPWTRENTDLDREVEHHLAELTDHFLRAGHSPKEARRLARRAFGGVEQIKEQCRDESPWAWLTGLRQDIAFGWRMMRKTPAVTLAAILSLALGIGANVAIVSLMYTVLWRQLPVPEPEQLSFLNWSTAKRTEGLYRMASGSMRRQSEGGTRADFFSYSAVAKVNAAIRGKADLASYTFPSDASLVYQSRPLVAQVRPVSANFFSVLGINAASGRLFLTQDDSPNATPTAVLSHRFWRAQLGSDPAALERPLRINNRVYQIIGITPSSFYGLQPGDATDLYVTHPFGPWLNEENPNRASPLANDEFWWCQVLLRRAPNIPEQVILPTLQAAFSNTWVKTPPSPETTPKLLLIYAGSGQDGLQREHRASLWTLAALVALLLAIACANIANLLLARATARRKEVALRISIGCTSARLLRQFLTESALLATIGGIASIAFALAAARTLAVFLADRRSRAAFDISIDAPMLLAAAAFTLLTLLLFGLYPAWSASRLDTNAALKEGSGSLGAAARRWWTPGKLLVVAQVALSIILVSSAVLFVRNLQNVHSTDAGFDRDRLVIFGLRPGTSGYSAQNLPAFHSRVEQALRATPGVAGVGLAQIRPMDGGGNWDEVSPVGSTKSISVAVNRVTAAYLDTILPRPIQGRNFRPGESIVQSNVAIISESLARAIDPQSTVLGRQFQFAGTERPLEIIGIAPDVAYDRLTRKVDVVWLPFPNTHSTSTVLIRTKADPRSILPAIEDTMRNIDPNLPLVDVITMQDQVGKGLQRERMFATLCGAFGVLALILSAIGLYGVISYQVSRRRNEIGVRLALGAHPTHVLRLVLGEGMLLVLCGMVLAVPIIYFGAQYVAKQFEETQALQPPAILLATLVLACVAAFAAWLPARRASRLDPIAALRQDN